MAEGSGVVAAARPMSPEGRLTAVCGHTCVRPVYTPFPLQEAEEPVVEFHLLPGGAPPGPLELRWANCGLWLGPALCLLCK